MSAVPLYAHDPQDGREPAAPRPSSSSLLLSRLKLGETQIYAPQIRALLGTASHFYEVVVLELRTVPIGTAPQPLNARTQVAISDRNLSFPGTKWYEDTW